MDMITLSMQALEAAIHTGSAMVDSVNHLMQNAASAAEPPADETTCKLSECRF